MKKALLLFTVMLTGLTTVTAAEKVSAKFDKDLDNTSRYRYTQPIMFVQRGVEFLIFTDGSFDFNANRIGNTPRTNHFYRNRSGNINRSFGAPGTQYSHRGSRPGVRVTHDYLGRVRRIGNVFVNYDNKGRIKRVGSVYMRYSHGLLKQVGKLRLQYNRRGHLISTTGYVNFGNQNCGFCGASSCSVSHFENYNNHYYRNKGKIKKYKKIKNRQDDDDDDD